MQFFLALAGIVGAFAFGLGLMVLDRIEARATLHRRGRRARRGRGHRRARGQRDRRARGAASTTWAQVRGGARAAPADGVDRGLALLDDDGRAVFPSGPRPSEPEHGVRSPRPSSCAARSWAAVRVVKPTIVMQPRARGLGAHHARHQPGARRRRGAAPPPSSGAPSPSRSRR